MLREFEYCTFSLYLLPNDDDTLENKLNVNTINSSMAKDDKQVLGKNKNIVPNPHLISILRLSGIFPMARL